MEILHFEKNQTAEMTASPWGSTADPGWQVSWWVGSDIRGNYPTWRTEKGGNKENWVTPGNRAMSSVCMVESQKGKEKGEKMGQSAMASNFPKFYSFQKSQTRRCAGQWPIAEITPLLPKLFLLKMFVTAMENKLEWWCPEGCGIM